MVKIEKSCDVGINNEYDIATSAAVASIGTTKGFEFFSLYRNTAISTFTSGSKESYTINECCHLPLPRFIKKVL
jgi:hypothetical protein